jgi:hypothetical protein
MRRLAAAVLIAVLVTPLLAALVLAQAREERPADASGNTRFGHVDVYIDAGDAGLAAYQCDIAATAGDVTLVGIEGGEHAAFKEPPYYDPRALGRKHVILGAFSTASDVPRGKTRIARLMVQITGATKPVYEAKVQVAASPDGKPVPATISVSDSEGAER